MLEFKKVTLDVQPLFEKYLSKPGQIGCECAFSNHFNWQDVFHTYWCVSHDSLLIKVDIHGVKFFLQPFGAKDEDIPAIMEELLEANEGEPFSMHGIYEDTKARFEKIFPGIEFEEDRDNWDYVYLREKIETLGGRKLHGQKNHFNAFVKAHPDYTYEPVTKENLDECLAFAEAWCDERSLIDGSDAEEKLAIQRACQGFEQMGMRGGLIRFDGKIQAFSMGMKVNEEAAVLHFEKATPGVRGLYPAICKEFALHAWQDVKYLNREEDMGLPGLRKAKQDLNPEFLWKKYNITYGGK